MPYWSALAARSRGRMRRLIICAALAAAGALSGVVGLAFASCALFEAWRLQYGVVTASIGLSVIYLVVALILFLCIRMVGAPRSATASLRSDEASAGVAAALKSTASASDPSDAAALAVGVQIAKQLTPLQLALLAAISGFIAGRRL
jgi:ABC-type siderophore export system fused ATPase/permease subunit